MPKPDSRRPKVEPDPNWRPLVDAIFLHTYANELASGQDCFRFGYSGSNAPASIEVSPNSRTFKLIFNDGKFIELPPWKLLDGEKLLITGLAARFAHQAVWKSWQFMLERFASAVSEGRYALFARLDDFRAPFESIPRDHWPSLQVNDWSTGVATAPDGRQVWNIHVLGLSSVRGRLGPKPKYDQDQINGEVRRLFRKFGPFGASKEQGWQTRTDLQERIAQFLLNTSGQSPAKSTLQVYVQRALEAIEADKT